MTVNLFRFKVEANGIDAVSFAGIGRTVVEDVPEVATATRARDLGADHAMRRIRMRFDRAGERRIKRRPAGAGIEFSGRVE